MGTVHWTGNEYPQNMDMAQGDTWDYPPWVIPGYVGGNMCGLFYNTRTGAVMGKPFLAGTVEWGDEFP